MKIFEENQTGLHHHKTHCRVTVKHKTTSGRFQAILFSSITLNPESNSSCREKHHSLILLKYIDVTQVYNYIFGCNAGENIVDYWNVDGGRELSDTWTGFTRFTVLDEEPSDGFSWSGRRLTRKQTTSRPDTLWPVIWKDRSDASKRKEKQKVGYRKTEARQC